MKQEDYCVLRSRGKEAKNYPESKIHFYCASLCLSLSMYTCVLVPKENKTGHKAPGAVVTSSWL